MSQRIVEDVKASLISRGIIPVPQTTYEHAFEITGRVAFILKDAGAMLVLKHPPQTRAKYKNAEYGVDFISFPDYGVDMLVSAGPPNNTNGPTWQVKWGPRTSLDGLAAPFDMDADIVEIPGEPPEKPPEIPNPDEEVVMAKLEIIEGKIDKIIQIQAGILEVAINFIDKFKAGVPPILPIPIPPPPPPPPQRELPQGYSTNSTVGREMLLMAMQRHKLDPVEVQRHGIDIVKALNETWPGLNVYLSNTDAPVWPGFGSLDVTIDSGKGGWSFRPDGWTSYNPADYERWAAQNA